MKAAILYVQLIHDTWQTQAFQITGVSPLASFIVEWHKHKGSNAVLRTKAAVKLYDTTQVAAAGNA